MPTKKRGVIAKESEVAVFFGLSKGEGVWPSPEVLGPDEKSDLRSFCTFFLDLDEGIERAPSPSLIRWCKVIYDGVTPIPSPYNTEEKYGLWADGSEICAKIRPIILFGLSRLPSKDLFTRFVWGSSYRLAPKGQEEPFYSEDWNGYTEILSATALLKWEKHLREHGAYSGKKFQAKQMVSGVPALKMSPRQR